LRDSQTGFPDIKSSAIAHYRLFFIIPKLVLVVVVVMVVVKVKVGHADTSSILSTTEYQKFSGICLPSCLGFTVRVLIL